VVPAQGGVSPFFFFHLLIAKSGPSFFLIRVIVVHSPSPLGLAKRYYLIVKLLVRVSLFTNQVERLTFLSFLFRSSTVLDFLTHHDELSWPSLPPHAAARCCSFPSLSTKIDCTPNTPPTPFFQPTRCENLSTSAPSVEKGSRSPSPPPLWATLVRSDRDLFFFPFSFPSSGRCMRELPPSLWKSGCIFPSPLVVSGC